MASRHGEAMPKSEQSELFVRREACATLAQVELGAIITTKGSYETASSIISESIYLSSNIIYFMKYYGLSLRKAS